MGGEGLYCAPFEKDMYLNWRRSAHASEDLHLRRSLSDRASQMEPFDEAPLMKLLEGLGAWISYITRSSLIMEVTIQSFVAFGFPFTVDSEAVFEANYFFKKIEELGRLRILTLTLQIAKNLNILFVGVCGASYFALLRMSFGLLYTLLSR
ncbi:hypothetical protein LWI29_010634 [Acer saccharum]|uniref:Uncharacterized protein n=1 Tax=Acer saccharum TaxID=4024 RepID=A0AA39VXC5_ACESA|nr:hypothetical protein LWI29_010634 [Acer saccharum]